MVLLNQPFTKPLLLQDYDNKNGHILSYDALSHPIPFSFTLVAQLCKNSGMRDHFLRGCLEIFCKASVCLITRKVNMDHL